MLLPTLLVKFCSNDENQTDSKIKWLAWKSNFSNNSSQKPNEKLAPINGNINKNISTINKNIELRGQRNRGHAIMRKR